MFNPIKTILESHPTATISAVSRNSFTAFLYNENLKIETLIYLNERGMICKNLRSSLPTEHQKQYFNQTETQTLNRVNSYTFQDMSHFLENPSE